MKAEIVNLNFTPPSLPVKLYRKAVRGLVRRGLGSLSCAEMCLVDGMPDCDVNVATFFFTAFPTYYSGKGRGFYLVQNFEPSFFSDVKDRVRAGLTYALPLKKLCVSKWLTDKVGGCFIGNGINLVKFRRKQMPKVYDVMVIARRISWKGNYAPVVDALRRRGFSVLVVDGLLSEEKLVDAYNSSRVFLFLSEWEGFGYPPLEAMACGVPVVTTPCLEYVEDLDNACILRKGYSVGDVVESVEGLLADVGLYGRLSLNGV